MLDFLRKGSKSWVAKSLLILLVLSFGVWGIADYVVSGGGPKPAITVGDQTFSPDAVRNRLTEDLARLRRQGMDLSTDQAVSLGLLGQTVQRMVEGAVLDQTARDLNLTVTDDRLRRMIQSDPLFQGEDGRFDRERLNRLLAANGLTEAAYVDLVRQDVLREAVVGPIVRGAAVPDPLLDRLAAYASERRRAQVLRIADAAMAAPAPGPEDEPALEALYQTHIDRFTDPEYRQAALLVLDTEAVRDRIAVSDDEIREVYEAAPETHATPATRSVTQALFPDRAQAQAARALVVAGTHDLDAASRAITGQGALEMGAITGESLPDPLPDMIFDQPVGTLSEPVETAFGWHLFLVTAAQEGGIAPLESVRETVRAQIVDDKALESLYALSTEVEDALAGGASLEEAAAQVGVLLRRVTLDRTGAGPDGQPVAGLPAEADLLDGLFALEDGQLGPMTEFDQGFFIQRLEAITPATPRPLDSVREAVVALWQGERQAEAALALADALTARAAAGETLAALAAQTPQARLETTAPLTRDPKAARTALGEGEDLPPGLLPALFAAARDTPQRVDLPDGAAVVVVTAITQPEPDVATQERERLAQVLRQSYGTDVAGVTIDALSRRLGVTINESAILGAVRSE